MREKFANNATTLITKYYVYEGKELDKLKYGLLTFYSFATKTAVIIIISLLLGTIKETMVLMFFYMCLRIFAFGIHASKNIYCWLTTLPVYIIAPYISKILMINDYLKCFIIIISIISFLLYAPADTPKRPLINTKKRHFSKTISMIIVVFFELIILYSKNSLLVNSASLALIIQCICLYPITYKIFKIPYRNYRTYIRKV